ncbi:cytochrome ubiquinol oxidase subunit I [Cysteiniphilum sp. QT6929]|uniref:cytochrome ubiquinol oxidase subunit I n=1 Tax=Cysteiniphilum sp. QT6929 TaxID=2975055 RepID=UPI0024B32CA4|nr:cytochrome ubiquinol oxidase subunit I [Cysteiniphilum sp. QT6929]WHN65873.1 cytochrome ubiquinol oxidase subunit I [Cysteiniphilum sp. QT6929]
MIPSLLSVELARWQFAFVACFHFIFVPLTLGLTWIIFTMELMYVITGKQVYKDMTKFWGKLLGINFAVGVLSGLTMEFSFGLNWAYYSQFVGDIFGTPLAIEGLVAFMLESTFVGMFFLGWNKLSKKQHLCVTFCLAIGSNLSALLILVANGFMQVPAGGEFVWQTMRMETTHLWDLFINPIAQIGFAHTVIAGYVTSSVFVIGISAFYLLRKKNKSDVAFAKRSMGVGLGFGLIASLMVMVMGDEQGILAYKYQPMKLAAIEAEWGTQAPPANFNVIAFPNQSERKNDFSIQIPHLLGLLATHSFDQKIYGVNTILFDGYTDVMTGKEIPAVTTRIANGAKAYEAMMKMRDGSAAKSDYATYNEYHQDLGYGMLLLRYLPVGEPLTQATSQQIRAAALDTVPNVSTIFWTFRIMVGIGVFMFLVMIGGLILLFRKTLWQKRWVLRTMLYMIPLPWIACLCGWIVTEHGRQPWTVYDMLPTTVSSSMINGWDILFTLVIFCLFYALLFAVEMYLMFKFARLGPSKVLNKAPATTKEKQ